MVFIWFASNEEICKELAAFVAIVAVDKQYAKYRTGKILKKKAGVKDNDSNVCV